MPHGRWRQHLTVNLTSLQQGLIWATGVNCKGLFRQKKCSRCKWVIGYNTRGFLHLFLFSNMSLLNCELYPRIKISISTHILVFGFYGYIINISVDNFT